MINALTMLPAGLVMFIGHVTLQLDVEVDAGPVHEHETVLLSSPNKGSSFVSRMLYSSPGIRSFTFMKSPQQVLVVKLYSAHLYSSCPIAVVVIVALSKAIMLGSIAKVLAIILSFILAFIVNASISASSTGSSMFPE